MDVKANGGEVVSYDTKDMVGKKVEWLKGKGLGGVMWWEASGDRVGEGSLLGAAREGLGGLEGGDNCLNYPKSVYENLKGGILAE